MTYVSLGPRLVVLSKGAPSPRSPAIAVPAPGPDVIPSPVAVDHTPSLKVNKPVCSLKKGIDKVGILVAASDGKGQVKWPGQDRQRWVG